VKLLAIDESSSACGFAYFEADERPLWTRVITARGDSWRHRMRSITATLRPMIKLEELTRPDVVAIEDAVVARPRPKRTAADELDTLFDIDRPVSSANPMTGVKMGECRGWLMAHIDSLWPDTRIISVAPAKVRAAAGLSAFARRDESKVRYRIVAEAMLPGRVMSEDECDSILIGLAAFTQLREERWHAAS
jgi:Holliday junction resolvasome RuvABC endonuclease subunit